MESTFGILSCLPLLIIILYFSFHKRINNKLDSQEKNIIKRTMLTFIKMLSLITLNEKAIIYEK